MSEMTLIASHARYDTSDILYELPFHEYEQVHTGLHILVLGYNKVEKSIDNFFFDIRNFVSTLLMVRPERTKFMSKVEQSSLLKIFVVNKFGEGFKNSTLTLSEFLRSEDVPISDYLRSKDARDQLPDAYNKCYGLFQSIATYYNQCVVDVSIREHLKELTFNKKFLALVSGYITHNTLQEVAIHNRKIKNDKFTESTKQKLIESESTSSSSSIGTLSSSSSTTGILSNVIKAVWTSLSPIVSPVVTNEIDKSLETINLDFGNDVVFSILEGPFTREYNFKNVAIEEHSLRYTLILLYSIINVSKYNYVQVFRWKIC